MITTIYTGCPSLVQMIILSVLMVGAIVALWYVLEDIAFSLAGFFRAACRRQVMKTANRVRAKQARRRYTTAVRPAM